jgi:aryl-alcohol dehydrogenase-like predicted oxidoreductase
MSSDFHEKRVLGRTGLKVGRLGVAASYGAPTEAFEEAFDRGVNYFYWGSRRTAAMGEAIRRLVKKGKREEMVLVLQSYSRHAGLMRTLFKRGLRTLGLDSADVLLLGWHNALPSPKILDQAMAMRDAGLVKAVALSGHKRPLFPELAADDRFGLFHVRYNAVHRGAEQEIFPNLPKFNGPGMVTFTTTRWGDLLNPRKLPPGEAPLGGSDCYRFALSHPAVDLCMCGPKDLAQMREALLALDLGPLSPEEMARMRRIGDHIHAKFKRPFSG